MLSVGGHVHPEVGGGAEQKPSGTCLEQSSVDPGGGPPAAGPPCPVLSRPCLLAWLTAEGRGGGVSEGSNPVGQAHDGVGGGRAESSVVLQMPQ